MNGLLETAARPLAPFIFGFFVGVGFIGYTLYDFLVARPPQLQHPWEHDGVIETYIARWNHYDWQYSVLIGAPFVVGMVTWVLWFVLSLIAGVSV